jgi:cytochrome c-type biogenesis protein CcmH
MGWIALGVIGVGVAAALWLLGVARPLWSLLGAGLMLGATGYALQGRPNLPGHPVEAFTRPIALEQGLIELRGDMLGRFTGEAAYLTLADGLTRAGNPQAAVRIILGGVNYVPNSVVLWTWLGMAYAQHDGGAVSPAARLAFEHAMRLAPLHPAPPFFYGMALIQSGDFAAARPYWARALALAPKGISYRPAIAERLAILDKYLAMMKPGADASR